MPSNFSKILKKKSPFEKAVKKSKEKRRGGVSSATQGFSSQGPVTSSKGGGGGSQEISTDKLGTSEKEKKIDTSVLGTAGNILAGKDIEIGGRTIKTGLGEREDVIAGTVPVGPVGPAGLAGVFNVPVKSSKIKSGFAIGVTGRAFPVKGTADFFKTNPRAIQLTTSFLVKAGFTAGAAFFIKDLIGTYPFAGFLKEEALQTLSFGVKSAIDNGDEAGAAEAIAFQEELLDPGVWSNILASIPYANVWKANKDFYEAARIKLDVDKQILEDMGKKESEEEKWNRIKAERDAEKEAEREADREYWAEVNKEIRRQKKEDRAESQRYWDNIRRENEKRKEEERKLEEEYWKQYRTENLKFKIQGRSTVNAPGLRGLNKI